MKSMKDMRVFMFFMAAVGLVAAPGGFPTASATELKPETLAAFNRYIALTEARQAAELSGASPFLWIDRQPDSRRRSLLARLKQGEIVTEKLETRDGKSEIDVPSGLIHHWIGTSLIPGVTMDQVMALVRDYAQYAKHLSPLIQRTKVLEHAGDRSIVQMRTLTKKIITVVMDADYVIEYRTLGSTRVATKNVATKLHEVDDAGTASERRTPTEKGAGYLWRFHTYCWFDQRAEGVYEQCESISLTRDVPFGFGWIIRPFITGIPRQALEFTLGQVRKALVDPRSSRSPVLGPRSSVRRARPADAAG
jgi:hypothetical protein